MDRFHFLHRQAHPQHPPPRQQAQGCGYRCRRCCCCCCYCLHRRRAWAPAQGWSLRRPSAQDRAENLRETPSAQEPRCTLIAAPSGLWRPSTQNALIANFWESERERGESYQGVPIPCACVFQRRDYARSFLCCVCVSSSGSCRASCPRVCLALHSLLCVVVTVADNVVARLALRWPPRVRRRFYSHSRQCNRPTGGKSALQEQQYEKLLQFQP